MYEPDLCAGQYSCHKPPDRIAYADFAAFFLFYFVSVESQNVSSLCSSVLCIEYKQEARIFVSISRSQPILRRTWFLVVGLGVLVLVRRVGIASVRRFFLR